MIERIFTSRDQSEFARLSGDRNPLHLDPQWARTVFPGAVVVHGMHALLWALEGLGIDRRPSTLTVSFLKPILLDECVRASRAGDCITLTIRNEPVVVARLDAPPPDHGLATHVSTAIDGLPAHVGQPAGSVPALENVTALCAQFPSLTTLLGAPAVNGLAALSTLVGMHCPGLHSMFSGFTVAFSPESGDLCYRVMHYHRRFGRVSLSVRGQGLIGTVDAFSTEPAPSLDVASTHGVDDTFSGQQPLIIGGSSGLGATTAWLLAVRGAAPVVTYHGSKAHADRLAAGITASGGQCTVINFDVDHPDDGLAALRALPWTGSQAYYFASPRIFRRRLELYQAHDMCVFVRAYVDGFYECVRGLSQLCDGRSVTVFYPSSVAVEHPPADLLEYAFAKRIGELLCQQVMARFPNVTVVVERLPRIATRQTQAIVRVPAQSPEEVMLPIIRTVQGRA